MHKHAVVIYGILLSLCLWMMPGHTLGVSLADDEEGKTSEELQQVVISLRREFKLQMAQAEQDRRLIYENIQVKFKDLMNKQEVHNSSQPEITQKAQTLLALLQEYDKDLTLLEHALNTIETTMNQNLDDLETQLASIKKRGISRPMPVTAAESEEPEPESSSFEFSPGQLFRAAYRIYMDGDYEIAIAGFQKYLQEYPDTQLAGAAQYWIAESLAKLDEYDIAIQEYQRLIQQYPLNDKIADAHYGIGAAMLKLGRDSEAQSNFTYVVVHFPGTIAAQKAQNRLDSIR